MPTTSPRGGPQPPQLAPKSWKKLKKSHPRRLHGHLAVPPSKQAQNLAQEQFLALQLKISHCDMPTTSPCRGPQPPQLAPKSWKKLKFLLTVTCMRHSSILLDTGWKKSNNGAGKRHSCCKRYERVAGWRGDTWQSQSGVFPVGTMKSYRPENFHSICLKLTERMWERAPLSRTKWIKPDIPLCFLSLMQRCIGSPIDVLVGWKMRESDSLLL